MSWLFGGSKKKAPPRGPPPPPPKPVELESAETIKELRMRIDQMEKRRKMLDAQTTQQDEVVRQKVRTKDKAGARVALLKKQQIVKQSTNLDNQILALENQCMQLENASTNIAAVKGMETALNMQKKIANQIDSDKVENLMSELEEQNDLMNEVNDMFASNAQMIGGDMDLDEELEELEAQVLEQDLMRATAAVPSGQIGAPAAVPAEKAGAGGAPVQLSAAPEQSVQSKEEEELDFLKAELGLA